MAGTESLDSFMPCVWGRVSRDQAKSSFEATRQKSQPGGSVLRRAVRPIMRFCVDQDHGFGLQKPVYRCVP